MASKVMSHFHRGMGILPMRSRARRPCYFSASAPTYDALYPYVKEVAAFWEDYLKFEPFDGVRILSEKGRDCTVQNPWPECAVRIARNGKRAETGTGERFMVKTHAGERLELLPVKK